MTEITTIHKYISIFNILSGPELFFKTCIAMKFVDDDDDDDNLISQPVMSLGLVSSGVATDGVTPIFS